MLVGCGKEQPHIEYIENGVANFRNIDHIPHTNYNISGKLKVSFYENYVKIEEQTKSTIHYVPLDKIVYIGTPIPVN